MWKNVQSKKLKTFLEFQFLIKRRQHRYPPHVLHGSSSNCSHQDQTPYTCPHNHAHVNSAKQPTVNRMNRKVEELFVVFSISNSRMMVFNDNSCPYQLSTKGSQESNRIEIWHFRTTWEIFNPELKNTLSSKKKKICKCIRQHRVQFPSTNRSRTDFPSLYFWFSS